MKKNDDDNIPGADNNSQKPNKKNSLFDDDFFDEDDEDEDFDDDEFNFDDSEDDDESDDEDHEHDFDAEDSINAPHTPPTGVINQAQPAAEATPTPVSSAPGSAPVVMPFGGGSDPASQPKAPANAPSAHANVSRAASGQHTHFQSETVLPGVQFRVGCELGQVLLPYQELNNLQIGNVVNFNNTAQTLVLTVNNVKAGEGMLVNIDGKIGIKITRWYGNV